MKLRIWLAIAGIATVAVCGLPLLTVIADTSPASACAPAVVGSSGQVVLREHPGPVGKWTSTQTDNAAIIVAVGQQRQVPIRGWVIAVATAMTESRLINTSEVTDHDSVGLFQQRPSKGWGTPEQVIDPVYASTKFYAALVKVNGWQTMPLTEAAQKVQRSAFPDRYAEFESDAEQVVAAVVGAATITDLPGASLAICDGVPAVSAGGWVDPVAAEVGSRYGQRDGRLHAGVDLMAARNTVIHAAAAGRVIWADCDPGTGNCNVDGSSKTDGCGWFVEVLHAGDVATRYCHLVRRPEVAEGDTVTVGQPLGLVGTSGHSSGPHLHFEVHLDVCNKGKCDLSPQNSTDPVPYMRDIAGAPLGP
jgi:murein DD-endopeptidase MepM/ murein hydrolase activator NlpD